MAVRQHDRNQQDRQLVQRPARHAHLYCEYEEPLTCSWSFTSRMTDRIVLRCPGQITMKRQSLLYIVNFLLPILFLLSLDIASFLISEREGEKLGFKVTVLLGVTVMQLLLNEILPSSSDRIPLVGKAAGVVNILNNW